MSEARPIRVLGKPLLFHIKIDPMTGEWHAHSNRIPVRVKGDDNRELNVELAKALTEIVHEQRKNGTLKQWFAEREWVVPTEPISDDTVFDCPYQTRKIVP